MTQLPYPQAHEEVVSLKERFAREAAANKIEKMYKLYGRSPSLNICGDCEHFVGMKHSKVYFKCKLFGVTGGPGTDWRKKWPACGKWEKAE